MDISEFTVDRRRWIKSATGLLLRCDGKRCILGFYLAACGIPDEELMGFPSPGNLFGGTTTEEVSSKIPGWLIDRNRHDDCYNSVLAERLMEVNDDETFSDEKREQVIREIFAQHGVEVRFVG